jgi:hypothetical protein
LRVLRANGKTSEVEPPKQLAHAALMQADAKFGGDAVTQIDAPEPYDAIAGQIGALLDPGGKLALFDPTQFCRPAASRPIDKSIQTFLVVAVNPVTQALPIHSTKPSRLLAAEAIENHGDGHDTQRLPGVCRYPRRRTQIGRAHIHSSNRNPSHLAPANRFDAIDSQIEPEGNPPS